VADASEELQEIRIEDAGLDHKKGKKSVILILVGKEK
jgi:hypothetical protein